MNFLFLLGGGSEEEEIQCTFDKHITYNWRGSILGPGITVGVALMWRWETKILDTSILSLDSHQTKIDYSTVAVSKRLITIGGLQNECSKWSNA